MTDRLFYVETQYQFLQAMTILVDWRDSGHLHLAGDILFIDGTADKIIYSKRHLLKKDLNISILDIKVYPFYLSAVLSLLTTYRFRRFRGCNFYMFNNRSPVVSRLCAMFGARGDVVQIEEGLSLYRTPKIHKPFRAVLLLLKKMLVSALTFSYYKDHVGHSDYSDTVLLRYPGLAGSNKFLSSKKIIKLSPLENLSFISSTLNSVYGLNQLWLPKSKAGYVVFFGQPLGELGLMDSQIELESVRAVANVVQSLGLNFLIKTHPGENEGKYSSLGIELLESDAPAELMFSNALNVEYVVSFYSTAALNVSEMLDIPAYFMFECCGLNVDFPSLDGMTVLVSLDYETLRSEFLSN
jgi:hypothetical protein